MEVCRETIIESEGLGLWVHGPNRPGLVLGLTYGEWARTDPEGVLGLWVHDQTDQALFLGLHLESGLGQAQRG